MYLLEELFEGLSELKASGEYFPEVAMERRTDQAVRQIVEPGIPSGFALLSYSDLTDNFIILWLQPLLFAVKMPCPLELP